jgi:hypothetical protein
MKNYHFNGLGLVSLLIPPFGFAICAFLYFSKQKEVAQDTLIVSSIGFIIMIILFGLPV